MKNRNKKILFINYEAYPCIVGGLEIFNLHFINRISKIFDTSILTFCNETQHVERVKVNVVKRRPFSKLMNPISTFFFLWKERKNIDLIHISYTHAYWTHYYIYVVAKSLLKIPYIVTIHDGKMAKWSPKWPYIKFFNNAACVTGVSDAILKGYKEKSKRSDLVFTPPLVPFKILDERNLFRSIWDLKADDFVLLFVGALKPLKSVETLLDALGLIENDLLEKRNFKLVIAGDGVSRAKLEEQTKKLNLSKYVDFLGNVNTQRVHELYNFADLFTLCSEYEGLPISVLEAFANKVPCVTSDAPGLKEISLNNTNTLLFESKNHVDYADKISRFLRNEESVNAIGDTGFQHYKNTFTYDKLIDQFEQIIDNAIQTKC